MTSSPLRAGRVPADIEPCVELWVDALRHRDGQVDAEAVGERTRQLFAHTPIRFAVTAGTLVGFALTMPAATDPSTAMLERLAVRPGHGGSGIGRALLHDAISAAADAGFTTIELAVRVGNPAIHLYRTSGFEPVSDPVPHPLGGAPMVTYRRPLAPA